MSKIRYSLNKNKYLLDPELERLNFLLKSFSEKDSRNVSLLRLALETGARATEILNTQAKDLNSYDKSLLIKGIKGSNDREIPLRPELFGLIEKQIEQQIQGSSSDRIFPISYNRLRQIWEHYRPVPKTFHSLRHTFAIQLYKKTRDIRLLQVALGHRNITNTMIYADYVYSQQELRQLIL